MPDPNLALGKPATSSTSVAPYLPSKAVNGDKSTMTNRWLAYKSPGWLQVDLLGVFAITRWAAYLLPSSNPPWPAKYCMAEYSLQISMDGYTWSTVDSVAGNVAGFTDRPINGTALGRYARLYSNGGLNGDAQAISLLEFEVYGHAVSADLSSLVLSSGALVPTFAGSTLAYTQQVGFDTNSVTVTPTATDPSAIIKVNGNVVGSGQTSAPISLAVGSTTITVLVTPVSGAPKTYTVAVTRLDSPYLSSLTVNVSGGSATLQPPFARDVGTYVLTLPPNTQGVTVTPVAESSASTIKVNGLQVNSGATSNTIAVNAGSVSISIEVSLPSGAKQTYVVATPSTAKLTGLVLKNGLATIATTPPFASGTFAYTASGGSANNITVTPTAAAGTTMTVNGTAITSTVKSVNVALSGASTLVQIVATDSTGSNTYSVTISKP